MSRTLTVTLTDAEFDALETVAISAQTWAQEVTATRANKAIKSIVGAYTERALDEDVAIPSTRDAIVADALARGWVETAAAVTAAAEAQSEE
jgi:hypothetical protein